MRTLEIKPMKRLIRKSKLRELIKTTNGRMFSIEFTKKDGTLRKMTARLGVTSHLRGGESTTAHLDKYISVYDMNSNGYRNINIDTTTKVKVNGKEYEVI